MAQCLRKVPSERPESARALRDALRRCRMVQPWTSDEAAAWWRRFRSAGPTSEHRADNEDAFVMSVDVAERLTHTAFPDQSVATR